MFFYNILYRLEVARGLFKCRLSLVGGR